MKQKTTLALLEQFINNLPTPEGTTPEMDAILWKIQELKEVERDVIINTWMDSDVCTNAEDYFNETFEQ